MLFSSETWLHFADVCVGKSECVMADKTETPNLRDIMPDINENISWLRAINIL